METLYFADEVRTADDITEMGHLDGAAEPSDKELAMAEQLLESLTTDWDPERYEDTYRVRVLELIESKAEGKAIVTDKDEESAPVIDLMAALEASVKRAKAGRAAARGGPSSDAADSSADGADSDGVAEMSKDDLYEEAQRLDIAGRSKMTKDELADAVAAATSKKGRRAS